jgi:hypothetical protein
MAFFIKGDRAGGSFRKNSALGNDFVRNESLDARSLHPLENRVGSPPRTSYRDDSPICKKSNPILISSGVAAEKDTLDRAGRDGVGAEDAGTI